MPHLVEARTPRTESVIVILCPGGSGEEVLQDAHDSKI